jgi:hypothetical protein
MIYKFDPFKFFEIFKIKIDSILDIGARKGDWTNKFKEHYPDVKSLMIEANGDHAEDLKKVTTLDSLLPGQRFDLIKMDVQGAELDILQGSPGFIHNTKYLWLELQAHNYNLGAPSAGKVIGYLHQIGFEIVTIDEINVGNGVIMGMDFIFINTRNKDLNVGYDITKKIIWSGYAQ